MWIEGIEVPVFEEFAAGTEALHYEDPEVRAALLRDPAYRKRFRREWAGRLKGRAYHRDLARTQVLACPDATLVGKSFAEIADERGADVVDTLLDLVATYDKNLRWQTIVANDRPAELEWIVRHPDAQIGFSDAGAHLRNMAYYNFPLRLLRMVHESQRRGAPIMSTERAVHRLTGELARWFGVDTGTLAVGARADITVVDPAGLDEQLEVMHDRPLAPGLEHVHRLVRRNDGAVRRVLVGGRTAWTDGALSPELGQQRGFGRLLRA
jgi:N-acyl-D-aspartate/D-glutamate deacylase